MQSPRGSKMNLPGILFLTAAVAWSIAGNPWIGIIFATIGMVFIIKGAINKGTSE